MYALYRASLRNEHRTRTVIDHLRKAFAESASRRHPYGDDADRVPLLLRYLVFGSMMRPRNTSVFVRRSTIAVKNGLSNLDGLVAIAFCVGVFRLFVHQPDLYRRSFSRETFRAMSVRGTPSAAGVPESDGARHPFFETPCVSSCARGSRFGRRGHRHRPLEALHHRAPSPSVSRPMDPRSSPRSARGVTPAIARNSAMRCAWS